jgi:hypothetical protein
MSDVVELDPNDPKATVCGTCGRGWDDSISTSVTPTPAGRCPFEYDHEYDDEDEDEAVVDSVKGTIHFDAPEFYHKDRMVLSVDGKDHKYVIVSDGMRVAFYHGNTLTSVTDFRNAFPDGNLPEMSDDLEWSYNGWFAVYYNGEEVGDPMFSLAEATTFALEQAYMEDDDNE